MRVTDSMLYELNRINIAKSREEVAQAQETLTTGRRVQDPSDDPADFAAARRERSREARAAMHKESAERAIANLQLTDDTLANVTDILNRARELATQTANDTLNAGDRLNAASEVEELRQQLISLANTQGQGGAYLFAGYLEDAPPFDASGTFVSDQNVREVEVAPGVRMPMKINAQAAFEPGAPDDPIAVLENLSTALRADDVPAIRGTLDGLDIAHGRVSDARGTTGALIAALDVAQSVADRVEDEAAIRQTELVGESDVDAYFAFNQAQTALNTAVQIAGELPPPSLAQR
ncbi:MAG: flagellar hook-associated protein FlgL [Myxococcota bacterium]